MTRPSPLAEYLRARRDQVSPKDVGLAEGPTPRRVAGLRREEVALLAGISPDYYLRLEQGRELHPSQAVLDGLVSALGLDLLGANHLFQLAWPQSTPSIEDEDEDEVSENILTLAASLSALPLHVNNRYLDLIYVNPLNTALSLAFRPGNNLARMVFQSTAPGDSYWRSSTQRVVAHLRASVGPTGGGPRLAALVSELSELSPRFVELWERHDLGNPSGFPMAFYREDVGHMEFRYQTFSLPQSGGKMLGVFSPAPGGPSAHALELLSLMIAESPSLIEHPPTARRWNFPSSVDHDSP